MLPTDAVVSPVEHPQSHATAPPPDSGIDYAQLREILAFSDAYVDNLPASEDKTVMMQVRRAVAWPLQRIMAQAPAERDELLTLRAELQVVLGGPH